MPEKRFQRARTPSGSDVYAAPSVGNGHVASSSSQNVSSMFQIHWEPRRCSPPLVAIPFRSPAATPSETQRRRSSQPRQQPPASLAIPPRTRAAVAPALVVQRASAAPLPTSHNADNGSAGARLGIKSATKMNMLC